MSTTTVKTEQKKEAAQAGMKLNKSQGDLLKRVI